jgi:hypothetical protein
MSDCAVFVMLRVSVKRRNSPNELAAISDDTRGLSMHGVTLLLRPTMLMAKIVSRVTKC